MEVLNVRVISLEIKAHTTTKRVSSTVCGLLSMVIWFGFFLYAAPAANADVPHDRSWSLSQRWNVFWASVFGDLTPQQEKETDDYITAEEDKYYGGLGYTAVGQLYLDGFGVTDVVPPTVSPTTVALTFGWVDPTTGLPVIDGSTIGGVQYYAFVGPSTSPPGLDLSDSTFWSLLGDSTNSSNGFLYDYTFPTSEQIIVAEPFDSSGDPISLGGDDGYGAALDDESVVVDTPEPATMTLFGLGLTALVAKLARRKNR